MIDQSKQDQNIMGVSQNSLEKFKFLIDELGRVAVRVGGSISSKGLSKKGKVTAIPLNASTWTLLSSGLEDVNTMAVQNLSGIDIALSFKDEATSVTPKTFSEQWILSNGGSIEIDIKNDTVGIYAIAESGTPTIKLMEIS